MTTRPHDPAAWYGRYRGLKLKLAWAVAALALIFGGVLWLKRNFLVIDPGKGAPLGWAVRTDGHIATLIQTLEAYTPSPNRDHSKDTYSIGLLMVPLDGSAPRLIPVKEGLSGSTLPIAKILGNDGHVLWYDVQGVGGVDLRTYGLVQGSPAAGRALKGAHALPFTPRNEAHLAAGLFMPDDSWLGLHSAIEVEGEFKPGKWLRRIVHAEDGKRQRRFHRGTVGEAASTGSRKILAMEPVGEEEYLNAAFLRMDDRSEPLRLSGPDGALMIHTSQPGLKGTLIVARVDVSGGIQWRVDTAIDRFNLQQILPGEQVTAFIGTRSPVPGVVSEPLLVLVEHATGSSTTHSLWR